MRILLTGADGMLSSNIISAWKDKYDLYLTGNQCNSVHSSRKYMKFDLMEDTYDDLLNWSKPDIIVHSAAITHVDYCENHYLQANLVNALSCKKLSYNNDYTKKIIYISTDAVFDGSQDLPCEISPTSPINFYGKTKLAGENYLLDSHIPCAIIRTTILGINRFYPSRSLVEWIYSSLKENISLNLFSDAYFSPISSIRLSDEIEHIINNNILGLYHISGTSIISKYQFGLELARNLGLNKHLIQKTSLKCAKFQAPRSFNQALCVDKYQFTCERDLPSIDGTIDDLKPLLLG